MRHVLRVAAACVALLLALPAAASPLDDAKAAGQLGEQADGYLGLPPGAPASARALADQINSERAEHYAQIAARNGTEPTAVAALAGQKLVERAPAGQWVRGPDGSWKKK
jgi:uncharacterized protein YdbL (DUF1318 family)